MYFEKLIFNFFKFFAGIKDISSSLNSSITLFRLGDGKEKSKSIKELNTLLSEASSEPPITSDKLNYSDKLLYIYTSGTTGLPKAAVITGAR